MTVVDVFPLYNVLVNMVFGSVALALVGVALGILLILILCRSSWTFIVNWMMFYTVVMFAFYIGSLGLFIVFLIYIAQITYNIVTIFFRQQW